MKTVFITHRADRSGAPLFLLEVITALKSKYSDIDITIVSIYNGPLIHQFKKLGRVVIINRFENRLSEKIKFNRITLFLKIHNLRKIKYDFAYANSSCSWLFCQENIKAEKVYFHLHELSSTLEFCLPGQSKFDIDYNKITKLICVSPQVRDAFLNEVFSMDLSRVIIMPGFHKGEIFRKSESQEEIIKIGAMGRRSDFKGFSSFIKIAMHFEQDEGIEFIWIGGEESQNKHETPKNLKLIPQTDNVDLYYGSLNIFCLLSIEDAFPLSVLESSRYNIPIICYDKYNGIAEIITEFQAGIVVNYGSINGVIDAISLMYRNGNLRIEMGNNCREAFSKFTLKNSMEILEKNLMDDGIIS